MDKIIKNDNFYKLFEIFVEWYPKFKFNENGLFFKMNNDGNSSVINELNKVLSIDDLNKILNIFDININKEKPSNIEVFEAIYSSKFFSYEMFNVLFNENSDEIANEFKQYLSNRNNTNEKNVFVKHMESFLLYDDEKRQSIIKSIYMEEILLNMIEIK